MQPTYLPWLGYLSMIKHVDEFVFLDNVQFDKRSWQQRNKIISNGKELVLSLSVLSKGKRDQLIKDVKFNPLQDSLKSHLLTIKQSYSKTPFFREIFEIFEITCSKKYSYLADFNFEIISSISEYLDITTPLLKASDLKSEGSKDELLFNICCELGCDEYYSPPGSIDYLSKSKHFKMNVKPVIFNFNHPLYKQSTDNFVSHISAIYCMFHHGKETSCLLDDYSIVPL